MSRLSDKVGRKPIIMISLMSSALGYLWCGVATTITSLLIARLVSGICGGTLPVVQAMVLDTVGDPRERPKYFGGASAMLGLGFMVGPALGAVVAFASGNKRTAFFSPVVIATMCCIIGFFKIAETRKGGICARKKEIDDIYEQGKSNFLAATMKNKITQDSTTLENNKNEGDSRKQNEKLPTIVLACAFAQFLAAFSFTCMTSMTGLVWMILFSKFLYLLYIPVYIYTSSNVYTSSNRTF